MGASTSTAMRTLEARAATTVQGKLWGGLAAVPQTILLLLIAAGVLARIVGVPLYTPDSGDEWGNTIAPFRVLFERGDPTTFFHPSLYYDVTAAVYAVLFWVLKASEVVDGSLSMTDVFVRDPRYFVFAARGVSVVSAVLAIAALAVLARTLWRPQEGRLAAALLATFPLHTLYAKTARVDSLFLLLFILAFSRIVRMLKHSDQTTYDGAGLLTGLATGANYNGAILALWLIAAHCLQAHTAGPLSAAEDPHARRGGIRKLSRALCLAAVAFVLSSPFVFLDSQTFAANFAFISGLSMAEHPGWESRGFFFYATDLAGRNPALCALIAVSSLALAVFGNRTERFVLSLPVGYLLLFSCMRAKDDRFILPAMVLFLLVASGLPAVLSKAFPAHARIRMLAAGFAYPLLLACLGTMAVQSVPINAHAMLRRPDELLFEWIEQHVPPRSTMLVESGIVQLLDTLKEPGQFAAALRQSIVAMRPGLDQQFIGAVYIGGRSNYDPGVLAAKHIDYAIISTRNIAAIEDRCDAFPDVCRFYQDLRAHGEAVFETPDGFEPVVVYQIRRQ
jgi:uncharacterized membrane protein